MILIYLILFVLSGKVCFTPTALGFAMTPVCCFFVIACLSFIKTIRQSQSNLNQDGHCEERSCHCEGGTTVAICWSSFPNSLTASSYKSLQFGLMLSINAIFFALLPAFNCFSLPMASPII